MAAENPQAPATTFPVPLDGPAHPPKPPPHDWLTAAQYRHVLRTVQAIQPLILLALTVLTLLMLEGAPEEALMTWLSTGLLLTALSMWGVHHFLHRTVREGVRAQLRAMRWHAWLWVANGVMWGSSVLLFAGQLEPMRELICWAALATVGVGGLYSAAAHVGMARRMVLGLTGTAMLATAWLAWGPAGIYSMPELCLRQLLLILPYTLALLMLAPVLARRHRQHIERKYQRRQLIHQLQKQTHAATRALDVQSQLMAGAMHDLRQPLSALSIYTDWLQTAPDMQAELTPKMRGALNETQLMLDTLLNMAHLEGGQHTLQPEPLDVADLLRALQAEGEPLAVDKGLRLRVRLPAQPLQLHADRVMLLRMWRNLLFNALRYTQQGGVLMAVRPRAGGVLAFEVWDTGIGISAEDQLELFRPFFRVRQPEHLRSNQPAALSQGVGLGLALVQTLAQQMGAQVQVRSRLGRGSLFRVLMPTDGQ